MMTNSILRAAEAIANADSILITAGAGIGVDSGLPDFRGDQGFWKIHPAYAKERLTFEDLANPEWFATQPTRAWGFYGYRYNLYQQTLPHYGFEVLKKWINNTKLPGFVFTTNVDGHFQKAGFSAHQIFERHGSINHLQCINLCNVRIWPASNLNIKVDLVNLLAISDLPCCPVCGGIARPNIKMFKDVLWLSGRSNQQQKNYFNWKQCVTERKLVIIEIGAGLTLGTLRAIGESLPGTLIRINPRDSEGPDGTISIAKPALNALMKIDELLQKQVLA